MAVMLRAGASDERELGDRAFYSDDYRIAAEHYRSARKLAEGEIFSENWALSTLSLGRALLFSGDIAGAKEALKEFRRRHPMRSAGTLPADIQAAEGKFEAAEERYAAIEASGNSALAAEAALGRGNSLLRRGKIAEAETVFRKVLNNGDQLLKNAAARELAYILIRQRKFGEASAVLAEVPAGQRGMSHTVLTALAEVSAGKLDGFKKSWRTMIGKNMRFPDSRCCELLTVAADAMEKQKDFALSAELLKCADKYAASVEMRKTIFKRLINLQSGFDPEGAADSAAAYAAAFPDDAGRYEILLKAADILASSKKFPPAVDLLRKLTVDLNVPRNIRFEAAVKGADFAELASNAAQNMFAAMDFHRFAVQLAENLTEKIAASRKYAGYFLRLHNYNGAVSVLLNAVEACGKNSGDDLKYDLLDAAVKAGDVKVIQQTAEQLVSSKNARYRCRSFYELGNLQLRQNKLADARKNFLAAAAVKEAGEYAVTGGFAAAVAAFKQGDFKSAGSEALALASADSNTASQALYLGYRAARQLNDENLKKQCAVLLDEKYPNSRAWAVYALQSAADRANNNRDILGAIADLEVVERRFANRPEIVSEAMFMRAGMLRSIGRHQEALGCAAGVISRFPGSKSAYYAAMLAGNIHYSKLNFAGALEMFKQAAKMRKSGLEYELAQSMVIQSMFQLNPELRRMAIADCDKLIASSAFANIRIEMRYRKAVALQQDGKPMDALVCYELLLNEAVECAAKGVPFNRNRCVRSAVNALQITAADKKRSHFRRGMRIIERCRQLHLERNGLDPETLKRDLSQKYSSNDNVR